MLLAYLLFIVGFVWLVQILMKDRLEITLPKVKWQSTPSSADLTKADKLVSVAPSVEEDHLLGRSKTVFDVITPVRSIPLVPGQNNVSHEHELLESPNATDESTSTMEFTQVGDAPDEITGLHQTYPFEPDASESYPDSTDIESEEGDSDEETTNGNDGVILTTFSDQLSAYPEGESITQPDEINIPLDIPAEDNGIEQVSIEELIDEETAATDVPLDKYFHQIQTVESILDDIRKHVRRKQSRQSVEELCTQFTAVLGYYGMINDKNVVTRLNNVLKPDQSSDYANLFMRVQRESTGIEDEEEESLVEEELDEVSDEVTEVV